MAIKLKYQTKIHIGEHTYHRPPLPKKTEDILFYNELPEKAFWLRLELPKVFYDFVPNYTELYQEGTLQDEKGIYKSYNKEDSDLFIKTLKQELHRREYGIHFRNGDEIEYITGHHYFAIQHCKCYGKDSNYEKFAKIYGDDISKERYLKLYMEYGYFYKYQRDLFYLIENVCKDPECLGGDFSKAKKTGVTFLFACYKLNKSTLLKMQQIGIMSKKQDDAIDTNMMYYFHAFDGLPNIFKPNIQTLAKAQGEIGFGAKSFTGTNVQKNALVSLMQDKALNSRVFCAPTKEKGFDAPKMSDVELDEFNKMYAESKVSPKAIFDTNKATVKMQDDITGKMWLFGYVSEENDVGVDEARQIYFDSKLTTKKGAARTKSELICYHISSLNSYLSLIDKYGECDEKEANKRIEDALERVKNDPKAYQSLKRQLARDEKEAWMIGGTKSTFNVLALTQYLYKLEEELRNNPIPLIMGELQWTNALWETGKKDRRPKGQFCMVRFVPITEQDILDGRKPKFILYKRMPRELENLALKFGRDDLGNLLPPDRFTIINGIDPTQYAAGDEVNEGSKNAMLSMNFHDEIENSRIGEIESKIIIASYFYRPDAPHEAYEDFLKWVIWTGSLSVVEANAPYVATRLIEEGLINYMVVRNKDKTLCLGKSWMKVGLDFNLIRRTANAEQNDMLETIVRLITNYIEIIKGEPNYLETIKIIELIKQLIAFDVKNTRLYDLVMAMGYMLLGYDVYYNSLLEYNDDYNSPKNYDAILGALSA